MEPEKTAMNLPVDTRLITCVLNRNKGGDVVLKALHQQGIDTAYLSRGRGSAVSDPVDARGKSVSFEKEMITILVKANQVDEIMEYLFEIADMGRPHGGFLYVEKLYRSVPFVLPDIPDEV